MPNPLSDQSKRVRDLWPRELWWCENDACNEPTTEDPCQFCGNPVTVYKVVPVALDDKQQCLPGDGTERWCPKHAMVECPGALDEKEDDGSPSP